MTKGQDNLNTIFKTALEQVAQSHIGASEMSHPQRQACMAMCESVPISERDVFPINKILGEIYWDEGEYKQALPFLEKSYAQAPGEKQKLDMLGFLADSAFHVALEERDKENAQLTFSMFERAAEYYASLLKAFPEDADSKFGYGYSLVQINKEAQALVFLDEKTLQAVEDDGVHDDELAEIRKLLKRYQAANPSLSV